MTDFRSIIGSGLSRRRIAAAIAIVGVVVVVNRLADVWPRNVSVAYELGPGVTELDVEYVQDGEALAGARFRQPNKKTNLFSHSVRLQPGEYRVRITLRGAETPALLEMRTLTVPSQGVAHFDLREVRLR